MCKEQTRRLASRYLQASAIYEDVTWGLDQLEAALQILRDVTEVWGSRDVGPESSTGIKDRHPLLEGSLSDTYQEIQKATKEIQGPISRRLDQHIKAIHRVFQGKTAAPRQPKARLDPKIRQQINRKFNANGLDGNGRFIKAEHGYAKAVDLMADFGLEIADIVDSWKFRQDSGTINIPVAFKTEDPFSPMPISNSMLVVAFHRLAVDSYEVLAYMS